MRKIFVYFLIISALAGIQNMEAKNFNFFRKKKNERSFLKEKTEHDKFLKQKPETHSGFLTLYKLKDKVFISLPLALIGREMLIGSTVSEISDNSDAIIGSKPFDPLFVSFSITGNHVNLLKLNKSDITDSPEIEKALPKNKMGAIFHSFKIDHYTNDYSAVVFDATSFFVADIKEISPFDPYGENSFGGLVSRTSSFKKDMSYISDIKAFESNVSIKSYLTYTYSLSYNGKKLREDVPFTALMTRSVILLDSIPYSPRPFDSRIGIFPTIKTFYSKEKQKTSKVCFANRWRLEPSDTAAFKQGQPVEPKKPIIFYIDPAFPKEWQNSIYLAVNQWQDPFEKIGFKNAIKAVPYPENDPEFDPDNIKYSCIRYAPIGIQNAMGPSWVDPRSGEILNASVYVYHDVVQVINNWRYIQTAQTDSSVRSGTLPADVFDDALRYVITHEVGHCLGFMHNMGSSSTIPVDSLRSPSFTKKHGTTNSIMDYARFNYVAQPGDYQKGVKLTPPMFGIYDYYAVKFNYTPIFGTSSWQEDYKITDKWLSEAQKEPALRYGKQQFGTIFDPHSLSEDLGDDAVKASSYGIMNLKYILSNLNGWVKNDRDYSYRKEIYSGIVYQYLNYIQHVYAILGGIYLHEKMEGDSVKGVECVPASEQKRAFDFLCNEIRNVDWLKNEELLQNIQIMGNPADAVKSSLIKALMAIPLKISVTSTLNDDPYTVKECIWDLYKFAFGQTEKNKPLNDTDMMMQREFVSSLFGNAGIAYSGAGADKKQVSSIVEIPGFLAEYDKKMKKSCCNHDAREIHKGEISSFDSPNLYFVKVPYDEAAAYECIIKIQRLLKRRVQSSRGETKSHYELLLLNIEKSLKNK